ncbi:MAG: aldose 1-epimerase family protein [bacterium]|nr:aldose 1-epimerase family protein [bacterium]
MPRIFGKEITRKELMEYTGDIRQIGGLERFRLQDGPEKGVEAVRARSGAGLDFTVLADRGLDIADAAYKGMSLAWTSPTGRINPAFYEPEGLGWLRGFPGGLLVTCGLTYAGAPGEDAGEMQGLHGRYSYIPASHVCLSEGWQGDDYLMEISGRVRQASVFGENLELERRISLKLGDPAVNIEDTVINLGHSTSPLMTVYHMNFGYPLLAPETRLYTTSTEVVPRDDEARRALDRYDTVQPPTAGFNEQVFSHRHHADGAGYAHAALINPSLNDGQGLGVHLSYAVDTLPWMVQWRMCGQGTYVMGLEPANCWVTGRAGERAAGRLQTLEAGESRKFRLRLAVLSSVKEIESLRDRLAAVNK